MRRCHATAYFLQGVNVNDLAALTAIAVENGEDQATVQAYRASTEDSYKVLLQARQTPQAGIGRVPFLMFNGRQIVSCAQPLQVLLEAMHQVISPKQTTTQKPRA